jgi:hypothetical protein
MAPAKSGFYEQVTDVKWVCFSFIASLPLLLLVVVDPRCCLSTVFLFALDEVLRWFFHGHSLSDPRDLFIPFFCNFSNSRETCGLHTAWRVGFVKMVYRTAHMGDHKAIAG